VQNVNELRNRTVRAAECVTNEMHVSTWLETEHRLDVCSVTNGAHSTVFENVSTYPIHFMVGDI
jgi:hypothetical protein